MTLLDFSVLSHFFLALFAIINPFGLMPVFVSLTSDMTPDERSKTALLANISVACLLVGAMYGGQWILDTFSISIDSFRVAGGFLILTIAFPMLSGKLGENKQNRQEVYELSKIDQVAIVPLAMPLMAGPGAISTTIVYASRYPSWEENMGLTLVILLFSIGVWLLFRASYHIVHFVGQTGINVITRLMGLLLGSMGIEMIAGGLKVLFPGLN